MKRRSHIMGALCHGAVVGTMSAGGNSIPCSTFGAQGLPRTRGRDARFSLTCEGVGAQACLLHPREFGGGVGGRVRFLYEARALRFAEG
jgi:hypothetical protein